MCTINGITFRAPPCIYINNVAPEVGLDSPKHVEHPKIKTSYKNLCILLVLFHSVHIIYYSYTAGQSIVLMVKMLRTNCNLIHKYEELTHDVGFVYSYTFECKILYTSAVFIQFIVLKIE